jgi:RHS repeat-associated protein
VTRTPLPGSPTTTFGYDNIYELLSATQGGAATESYTYDAVGNRLSNLAGSGWSNNNSNQLTARPGVTYTYDYNGNTLTKTDSTGTTTYAWDFENRLTTAQLPGTGGTITFKYDPLGRRIYKSSSSATSIYTYDGINLIEETNSSGAVVARYLQGLTVDDPLAMIRSSTTSFYQADGLGSITSLTNGAGALAQTYTFDSFGKQTASSGSLTNPFQYTARESDTEISLYFYRARYYDQSSGRFLNEDPLGFGGGPNFYTYVENDPNNFIDPSGKLAELYCETIEVLTGGILRASEKLALAALGIRPKHCFLRIACHGKDQFFELYGTDPEYRAGKFGRPSITPFNPDRAGSGQKIPLQGSSGSPCCQFEQQLQDSFSRQVLQLPPYRATGPNSNTFILGVINGAGGSANLPTLAVH